VIKQAPTVGRILAMVTFGLSCFGIVLYLWLSFGGAIPLKAKGYRFSADFKEAILLAQNADVRISGVPIGKVVRVKERPGVTRVTMEIDAKYAPVPRDTRAILRRKTALGEAYVELSPGNRSLGNLPDGGMLPARQVKSTVELDELVRDFDEETRTAMKRFVTGLAIGLSGRGQDINDSVGNLDPLTGDATQVLDSLDRQRSAVRALVSDTGTVFHSLGRRQGELSGIVRAGDRILSTTARRNRELAQTVQILPTTLRELRPTFREIEAFSREGRPVLRALRPAGRSLGGALVDSRALAPDLRGLFADLDRVIAVSPRAVPALTRTVRGSHPLVRSLREALRDLLPVVDYLGLYKQEMVTQLANVASTTQASEITRAGIRRHYLRTLIPFTPEGFVLANQRFGTNRHNPYFTPHALDKLATGLEAIDCRNTGNPSPAGTPAPPCKLQPPMAFRGRRLAYPHVRRDGP
jgi:phospholipid/cholesterol/gamma-HCH transport system substrate-binding protein